MIPRGQFHIPARALLNSFIELFSSDYYSEIGVEDFKVKLQNHLSSEQVELFSSCRIAFYNYLKHLDLPKGSEVLLTPITIPDMVNAILLNGLKPVFVEMDRDDHSFNMEDLHKKVGDNSKLILSTSLSGLRPKNQDIFETAKENDLIYIEDISQSPIEDYFKQKFCADVTVISLSVGKTITTLVGGVLCFKNKSEYVPESYNFFPRKRYFTRQLLENLKIDFFTSSFCYKYLTRFCLLLLSVVNKRAYFDIHKQNLVSKYNELDIFFDDIPVLRSEFPHELFFKFNSWMGKLGLSTLNSWKKSAMKRSDHRDIFMREASENLKARVSQNFINEGYFPIRVPFYVEDPEGFQLYCIKKGLDVGSYGLNICSDEEVFRDYHVSLPISEEIKYHCFFLNLNEKLNEIDIKKSINILNDYFGDT